MQDLYDARCSSLADAPPAAIFMASIDAVSPDLRTGAWTRRD
jgi:hypothetical protein